MIGDRDGFRRDRISALLFHRRLFSPGLSIPFLFVYKYHMQDVAKEPEPERPGGPIKPGSDRSKDVDSKYYYDDAHGYEEFDPEAAENDDDK